jgi:AraC family transcriptional regulator of adaptative response/methylated-DNA-[protein]-cysteine methyltransferase
VTREAAALGKVLTLIEAAGEPLPLDALAAAAGYSPHHFHRLFKRALGVTPAEYARGRRAQVMAESLERNGRVTDAIYDSGYSGPGRFYADARERLGMTPTAWRGGGEGETIRWATARRTLVPCSSPPPSGGSAGCRSTRLRRISAAAFRAP